MTTSVIGIKPSNPLLGGHPNIPLNLPFIEGSGSVVGDLSGNQNNGDITGASWLSTPQGWVLSLDGAGDYIDCGADESLDITEEVSLETLLKWTDTSSISTVSSKGYERLALRVLSNGSIDFRYYDELNALHYSNTPFTSYEDLITHVISTFDGRYIKIYINGELIKTTDTDAHTIIVTANSLGIGARGDSEPGSNPITGEMACYRLHDSALTAEEVMHTYLDIRRRLRV